MIKGVTKSIIEIIPRTPDFEKVIIILNSSCEPPNLTDQTDLKQRIELLTNLTPDFLTRQKRSSTLKLLISGVTGALVTAVSFLIIYTFV